MRPEHRHRFLAVPAIAALAFCLPLGSAAQQDVDSTVTSAFRPTFSIGPGMFAFYGDIGRTHGDYSPLLTRVGWELRASTPVTPWLEAGLFALHGRVAANERGTSRNLNFESRITTGGLQLAYNFHHFLSPDRVVEPFVSIGVEQVEFLSKTDLYDAQGRPYNYWSDGTIRDIPENAPDAGNAVIIQRDHVYESDVRELDLDGFGKYDERTFGIPVGVGARMKLDRGFDFRISTTMHFTFTDLVDGVTADSREDRAGNASNDRFLYTSFSIGYALDMDRKKKVKMAKPTLSPDEMDLLVLNDDEDQDGVPDMRDLCPHTPAGAAVDANGCPLDSDGDGVPDHRDDEMNTPKGMPVNDRGVGLDDDALLKAYLAYKDSANANTVFGQVESMGGARKNPVVSVDRRKYVVQVGSKMEGISQEIMQQILSLPDVRTMERNDTTFYVVGDYTALPDAVQRMLGLEGQGLNGKVMASENGKLIDVGSEVDAIRDAMGEPAPHVPSDEVVMRVQLGAFKGDIDRKVFKDVPDLVDIKGTDGLTRYYTGAFTDVNLAARRKVDMQLNGYKGAFLVAFKNGKRVSLQEAGARLTGAENLEEVLKGPIDRSTIRFRVQVGTFAGNVPAETMDQFIEVGSVSAVTSTDAVRYFYGVYTSREAAELARKEVQNIGLEDAFVVGEVNGQIVAAEQAERLQREP